MPRRRQSSSSPCSWPSTCPARSVSTHIHPCRPSKSDKVVYVYDLMRSCMLCAARLQAKGDEVMLETWTGDHRLQQDEDMSGSSKITIIWCAKDRCGDDLFHLKTCYCCLTRKDRPCYDAQQYCWNNCPRPGPHLLNPRRAGTTSRSAARSPGTQSSPPAVSGSKF